MNLCYLFYFILFKLVIFDQNVTIYIDIDNWKCLIDA